MPIVLIILTYGALLWLAYFAKAVTNSERKG